MTLRRWLPTVCACAAVCAQLSAEAGQQTDRRAREVFVRAVELQREGNDSAALALLWEAAGLYPRDADVQNGLGEALERMGALDAAVDAYRIAVAARPDFRKANNNLILALVKASKGPEAVERARALVSAAPSDPDRHFTLGLAQSEQDVAAAIETFRRVLELAPQHTLARYNLALVLRRADRLTEAADELHRAIAIEPRPEAYYTLGVIYWHQGDLDRAAGALGAAIAAQPGYADAHYALGSVQKARRDWRGAASSLRRAVELRPDLAAAHYTLAQVLRAKGDARAAEAQLAQAERLRRRTELEQQARMLTVAGAQQLEAGRTDTAVEHFRRATSLFDYAPAHYQLGLALSRLGQRDAAAVAFAHAQRLNPSLVAPPVPR